MKQYITYEQICHLISGVDIAHNKSVTASSIWENDPVLFAPNYAVNGQAKCDTYNGPIAHTKKEDNPWIKVDLQKTYHIKTVVVEPRTCKL